MCRYSGGWLEGGWWHVWGGLEAPGQGWHGGHRARGGGARGEGGNKQQQQYPHPSEPENGRKGYLHVGNQCLLMSDILNS